MTQAALLQRPPACLPARLLAAAAFVLHLQAPRRLQTCESFVQRLTLSPCILQPCGAAIASVSPFCVGPPPAPPRPRVRTSSRAPTRTKPPSVFPVRPSVRPSRRAEGKERARKAAREATEPLACFFLPSSLARRSPSGLHVLSLNEGGVVPVHYNDIQAPIHSATV